MATRLGRIWGSTIVLVCTLITAEYCFVEMIRSDRRKWMGKKDTLQRFAVLPLCRFAVHPFTTDSRNER